ncbi:hypothetical protein IQ229_05800 [Nostoc cf. edaphicum LEGE 07299]|uniref:Uncharacterized protein n=1 Tax=Nostoc cf. edaphicum LEGE 07299 TaxID=2777974 RepID=A0ABR9TWK1_9NOSO|nr:hypothetical protein [Nostoc edaphicum]MBE9104465.1 hypothetical protein [Nostoc cf. edaphicum LEGE 07299]
MSTTGYANAPFNNLRLFLLFSAWLYFLGLAVVRSQSTVPSPVYHCGVLSNVPPTA